MESKSSRNNLALSILEQIEDAIKKLQKRTKDISNVNDFLHSPSGMEKLDAACMLLIAIGESIKGFDINNVKAILSIMNQSGNTSETTALPGGTAGTAEPVEAGI